MKTMEAQRDDSNPRPRKKRRVLPRFILGSNIQGQNELQKLCELLNVMSINDVKDEFTNWQSYFK